MIACTHSSNEKQPFVFKRTVSLLVEEIYVSAMNERSFDFLLDCLRFDEKDTPPARRTIDKFDSIRELWDTFVKSCPGSDVTIDEPLLGFRGCWPFRIFLSSKDGIKTLMLCDERIEYD